MGEAEVSSKHVIREISKAITEEIGKVLDAAKASGISTVRDLVVGISAALEHMSRVGAASPVLATGAALVLEIIKGSQGPEGRDTPLVQVRKRLLTATANLLDDFWDKVIGSTRSALNDKVNLKPLADKWFGQLVASASESLQSRSAQKALEAIGESGARAARKVVDELTTAPDATARTSARRAAPAFAVFEPAPYGQKARIGVRTRKTLEPTVMRTRCRQMFDGVKFDESKLAHLRQVCHYAQKLRNFLPDKMIYSEAMLAVDEPKYAYAGTGGGWLRRVLRSPWSGDFAVHHFLRKLRKFALANCPASSPAVVACDSVLNNRDYSPPVGQLTRIERIVLDVVYSISRPSQNSVKRAERELVDRLVTVLGPSELSKLSHYATTIDRTYALMMMATLKHSKRIQEQPEEFVRFADMWQVCEQAWQALGKPVRVNWVESEPEEALTNFALRNVYRRMGSAQITTLDAVIKRGKQRKSPLAKLAMVGLRMAANAASESLR